MTKKHLKSIFVGCAIILILASSGLVIYLLYLIKTNSNPVYLPQIIREKIADFNPENYDDLLIKIGVTGVGNGAYQDGDIVMIKPSTHKWSKRERTEFLIVRVPKLTDEQKKELVKPVKKNEEIVKRRTYGVNYTNILNQKKIVLVRQKRKEFRRKPLIDLSQIIKKAPNQISVIPENKRLVKAKLDPPKYIVYLNKVKNYFFSSVRAATQAIHTIKEDGSGDYTTLASWEAGTQRDLVAADEIEIAQIDGTWTSPDTTAVTIDGWTTDADHYIRIYTTETARHNGKWDESKYRLVVGIRYNAPLEIKEDFVRVEGLQIEQTGIYSDGGHGLDAGAIGSNSDVRVSHSIIRCTGGTGGSGRGIWTNHNMKIWNNIIYDFYVGIGGSELYSGDTRLIHNNTVIDSEGIGINFWGYPDGEATFRAKNNLVQGSNQNYSFDFGSNVTTEYVDNLSEDDTSPNSEHRNKTVSFIDEANDDFHLAPNDTCARNYGTDLSSDPNLAFNDDIDGETRTGTWDIGADEEVPVEFVSTIMESGGDYDSLSSWESAINCDLTSTSTRVYSFSDHSGTIPDGTTVSTDSGASTATLLHQSNLNNQVLLVNIQGSFDAGDVVTDGTNTVTLSDNGAPAIAVAKIDGTWTSPDTTAVTIDGWTTDADHYIRIYTTETARHNGKWDESAYRHVCSTEGYSILINESYTQIDGLQFNNTNTIRANNGIIDVNAPYTRISNCIIKKTNGSSSYSNIGISLGTDVNGNQYVWNNIIYDMNQNGSGGYGIVVTNHASGKSYVYNNTIFNCPNGIGDGYADIVAKNNITQDCTNGFDGDRGWGSGFDPSSDYNISDISDDAPGSNSKTCTVSFIDEANDDFHLASNDTCAKDSGVDLFTDSNLSFSDDIDGESRSGTWDIGADEAPETPVEFVSTIMESGGDYDSLSSWESAINCDLTSTSTRVYSFSDHSGTIPDGTTVSTDSGASTATLLHQSNLNNQVLLVNIQGSFDAGDVVTDGTNTVTLSDNGASVIAVAKIDGTWTSPDTTPVVIDDWTTDADHYIRIYTTETARHNGKWDEGAYRLVVPQQLVGSRSALNISENYVRINGLQIRIGPTSNYSGNECIFSDVLSGEIRISNSILNPISDQYACGGIVVSNALSSMATIFKIWNNIIYNDTQSGRGIFLNVSSSSTGCAYVYNNTIYFFERGIYRSGLDVVAKNNITQDCTDGFYGDFDPSSDYNISDISGDAPGSNSKTCTVSFIDEANDDFHLVSSETCAKDSGVDLFTDSNLSFSDDIDGESRSGTWDIGADEAPETPVEFVSTIMESGGDYDSLSSWESAINCDLTSTSTRVYSFSDHSGTIPDGTTVSTDSGASTATLLHQSNLNNQVLLVNIQGSFDAGDVVTDGTNTVTLSDNGAPAIAVAKIDGTWTSPDTTAVTIDGWTTDADHYIRIYTTETARHDGKWNTSKYRLDGVPRNVWAGGLLDINEDHVRIEGIQVNSQLGTVSSDRTGIRIISGQEIRISYCIVKCSGTPSGGAMQGIRVEGGCQIAKIWNCIVYDWNKVSDWWDAGIYSEISNTLYCYNNTVYNCRYGYKRGSSGSFLIKNNIAQNCHDGFDGTFHSDSDYNISDISGDAPGSNSKTCTVSFVDEANGDFHLVSDDTCAKNSGVDLSSDPNLSFNDDIDGEIRSGTWDIGADEYVAAAAESEKSTQINTPITDKFTSGLVGYWTFNGADIDWSTNTAYDRSGQDNNGTIYGAKPAIGKVGQALKFDGVDDYVDIGAGPTGVKTIAFWVYPETTTEYFVNLVSDTDYIWANNGAVTATGLTSPTIYVDGVVSNTIIANKWQYIVVATDTAEDVNNLDIGRTQDTNYLQGKMDEVRLYNRVLSANEILDLYRVGARKFKIDPTKSGKTIIK